MRVLIQDVESRQFFSGRAGWVADVEEAEDFLVTTVAFNVARRNTDASFQIVLHLPESNELISFVQGAGWTTHFPHRAPQPRSHSVRD